MNWGRRRSWQFMEPAILLSVLEIVLSGTLDLRLASLLWLMMERRASVLVAAGPSQAGKSTTLNVLLDFLPPEIKQIYLQGYYEDFSFLQSTRPANTYMVAAEFGGHGAYVWGEVAIKAFDLISQGYALGGTIHARTDKEVVGILHQYLGLPLSTIARIDAIVTLRVTGGRSYDAEPTRRINTVSLVMPREKGLSLEVIASVDSKGNRFDIAGADDLQAVLSRKFNIKNVNVAREMEEKEQLLARLADKGILSRDEVRRAVIEFYRSRLS
jgi:energy-coupling factor transporter ATP-binding protein EcfA2